MSDSEEEDRGGNLLNQEAEESSDDSNSSSDSDSEDDEEEGDEEGDVEGLIDDTVEEGRGEESGEGEQGSGEEEDSDDNIQKKEKRKRSFEDDQLDDEDYALIAENTGIQLQRKKLRRVHMLDSDEEDEGEGGVAIGEPTAVGGVREPAGATPTIGDEEELSNDNENFSHIFGDSDEEEAGESQGSGSKKPSYLDEIDDEEDDFIVDEQGRPLRRRKGDGTYSEPALMEAQDIFGLDFDPAELEKLAREGLPSDDEEEEDEEYNEDSDLESEAGDTPRKKKHRKKAKKKTGIYDLYEPSELERGHFLERDAEIRVTDMPERFQTRLIPVKPSEEGELEEEAEWVFEHAFVKSPISKQPYFMSDRHRNIGPRGLPQQQMVPKIKEALNFMRNHSFEVPYIANYRREYVEPELDVHDLWKIYQWDEKWMQLKTRKQDMRRLFERMRDYQFEKVKEEPDKALTEDTRVLTDEDIMRLESVSSTEELSDVYAHFTLYYGKDLVAMRNRQAAGKAALEELDMDTSLDGSQEKSSKKATVKQAHRRDFYSICQENGLGSLSAKFGLTPEQFGENLRDNYQRHETEQHTIEPEEAAEDYVQATGFFSSVRAVLQGACHMVAMQIAAEPLVRQSLRQAFQSRAVICVKPTKKGRKMIDDSHPCCSIKYLRNKPLKELKGDEFLKLVQAEDERLIEMKISIDRDLGPEKRATGQTYFEDIRQLFYRDEFSRLVEKWNAQRAQAVAHALLKVLYPLMEKEMRNKLLLEAKEHVLQSCVHKFRSWLDMAPPSFTRELPEEEEESSDGPYARVLACAYSPDKTVPAFCCFLDGSGQVTDFLRLNNLLKRKYSPFDREREEKVGDLKNFKEFVANKRPELIVVGAESRESLSIIDEFRECLTELEQEEDVGVVPVELVDPNVARIYSKTNRAREEFPEYPELLRMAVSMGRRMQEPLHEFTALASSPDDEIFALKMHPLQDSLSKERLKECLELELVTRINDVGVDVNFVLNNPHAASMLNYVCGLGPRKAAALLKILKQENAQLENRSQLVMQCSFGPHLFINCVGFIKVDNSNATDDGESTYTEVLDSTRIHPETYVWARKMAVDALEYYEIGDENNPSGAVDEILSQPDKLSDLDLDAFAEELERQDYGNKKITLYDIRNELFAPFKERRKEYSPMTEEEKFSLLTGETPESLHEGKLVICTVVGIVRRKPPREVLDRANPIQNEQTHLWQCPFCLLDNFRDLGHVWQHFDDGSCPGQGIGVRARLENGLGGFIHTRNLSDKHVSAPEERVHIGMTIHCRILRVNLEKFSVDLTCKSSDLLDKEGRFSPPKDMYYDHDLAESDRKKEEIAQKKPQQKYFKRVIVHPSFMNCSYAEAEKALAKMDQGDAIFRPSSKGSDRLTLTWKMDDGIHIHVDIKEQNKPNQFSLGRSLWIGNDEYEDLDEILARYVQPIAASARDMLNHKCYKKADGGNPESLKKLLRDEKSKNPKRIPYFFSASKQLPGKFCLAYQPGSRPRIEYVTVTVDGYRYRNKMLRSINELIKWFKEHYQDPIPRPAQSTAPVTGSQIPSHITQSVDPSLYPKLQAAVNTAHQQQRGSSNTPYTPTHLAYSTGTPTPQYAHQQPPTHHQQYPHQQAYHGGGSAYGGGGANQYGGNHPSYGGGGGGGQFGYPPQQQHQQRGVWGGGGPAPGWTPSQAAMMRTPAQTPGRTPAYTPTQTPRSMTSSTGMFTPTPRSGGRSHHQPGSPMGTPLLDE